MKIKNLLLSGLLLVAFTGCFGGNNSEPPFKTSSSTSETSNTSEVSTSDLSNTTVSESTSTTLEDSSSVTSELPESSTPEESTPEVPEVVTYTFSFAGLTGVGSEISTDNALATFQGCTETPDVLEAVTLTKIYDGNGTGGAYPETAGLLKTGTSKVAGQIVLDFAEGTEVTKVEITCHDWYKKSESYPTNSNTVAVNASEAVYAPYNEEGTAEALVFEIEASNTVTIDITNRVFIFSIVVTVA